MLALRYNELLNADRVGSNYTIFFC